MLAFVLIVTVRCCFCIFNYILRIEKRKAKIRKKNASGCASKTSLFLMDIGLAYFVDMRAYI